MTDHQPPAFPRVSDSPADEKTVVSAPIFSRPGDDGLKPVSDVPKSRAPSSSTSGRSNGARWAVVGVATLLVVALIGAFIVFAGPKSGTPSTVARYAPADTVAYFEARLDLPGDQHNALAAFMSHFPGFADQAAFDQKVDETLDQLFASANAGMNKAMDWQHHIKPWFGGQVGVFSSTIDPDPGTPPSLTAAFSVKDHAALESWLSNAGEIVMYEGQEIHTGQMLPNGMNFAATEDALLVGARIEDVKRALDARADRQPGLADDQFFLQQLGALHADNLGLVYYDGRGSAQQLRDQLGDLGEVGQQVPTAMLDWIISASEARTMGELRADTDHLTVTSRRERPADADLPPLAANRTSNLAGLVPDYSLVYVEMRDVGQTISFVLNKVLQPQPGASPPIDLSQFDQVLGTSIPQYFDFITDVGLSYSIADDQLFGLVASVDDPAIAKARVQKLVTLARSLMQFGGGVTFEDKDFHGVSGTVIRFGSGAESAIGGIAVVVEASTLFIGNEEFVAVALDHPAHASLAELPEYQQGLAAGGANNAGVAFVNVSRLRALAEGTMSESERADYELNKKPFLTPLRRLMVVNTTEGTTSVSHVFLYVE